MVRFCNQKPVVIVVGALVEGLGSCPAPASRFQIFLSCTGSAGCGWCKARAGAPVRSSKSFLQPISLGSSCQMITVFSLLKLVVLPDVLLILADTAKCRWSSAAIEHIHNHSLSFKMMTSNTTTTTATLDGCKFETIYVLVRVFCRTKLLDAITVVMSQSC